MAGLLGGAHDAWAQAAPTDRVVLWLDVGARTASRTFGSGQAFEAFAEEGNFQASYDIEHGAIIQGGVTYRLWRNLAVGLDVSSYGSVHSAQITTELPHPFFFDLPRTTAGEASGLERQEFGTHLRAMWAMQFFDWLVVSASTGPSLISARQDLVTSVEHTEVGFPFDEAVFAGHTVRSQSQTSLGMNAGIDIDAYVLDKVPFVNRFSGSRRLGIGVLIRYLRSTLDLLTGDDPIDLGGLHVTTGIRVRF